MTNKTETKSVVLVKHHLKHSSCRRCMTNASRWLSDVPRRTSITWRYLLQLCELELIERERSAAERRLKDARFPAQKLLDEFDFPPGPSSTSPCCWTSFAESTRQARKHTLRRCERDGEDRTMAISDGNRRLSARKEGPLLPRHRTDHPHA